MGTLKLPGKVKFPLWLHKSGQWSKRHKGRCYYFGSDKDEALKRYVAKWEDIKAGREPKDSAEGATVGYLASHFLGAK